MHTLINSFFHTYGLTPQFIQGPKEGWRLRGKFPVRGKKGEVQIGLFKPGTHEVIQKSHYPEHHPALDKALSYLKDQLNKSAVRPFDELDLRGDLRAVQLIVERKTGKVQLTFVVNGEWGEKAVAPLSQDPYWHSVWINTQKGSTNTLFGTEWRLASGSPWFYEEVCGNNIAFHPACFGQANLDLFERIIDKMKERLLPSTHLLELFSGVGMIGTCLARQAQKVTCIELNPWAVEAFNQHKKPNMQMKTKDATLGLEKDYDTLVVDPPRKGCDLLPHLHPNLKQILYVSCSFPSLKRDVEALVKQGWKPVFAEVYDLFPGTNYQEILLDLRKVSG